MSIVLLPIEGLPEIVPGDDLGLLLADALERTRYGVKEGDAVMICQKIVSKAEGRVVKLADVEASERANEFAAEYDKDPAMVELALRESTEVLRMGDGHLITATGPGFIAANSGIDRSNQLRDGQATLLPKDSDHSARELRAALVERFHVPVAVVITDTFGRPWRMGQVDVAIGAAGIEVLDDHEGRFDRSGRPLEHTLIAVADQLAAAAGLLMDKTDGVPAVLLRGYQYKPGQAEAAELVRPKENDLFR